MFHQVLPVEWAEIRLKFAAPLRNERADATSEHADYLGLENIQSWTGKLLPNANVEQVADEGAASGTANRFRKGDVLFGKLRPYLAKALHADMDGVCTTELLVMTHQPDIYPRYLLYTVLSQEFVGQVDASTFGSKMPRANWEFIGSMKVPVPSLDIQRYIADYLDQETARIDALMDEKKRMLALLEEKRAALISRAVTRGLDPSAPLKPSGLDWLDEIPAHWGTPPVYARFEVQLGKMLDEKKIKGTHLAPYLRNVDVQWGAVNITDLPEMDFDDDSRIRYSLQKGDILVCEGGEIGRTAIWNGEHKECYYQKALHRLRSLSGADSAQFFVLVMKTLVERSVFSSQATAATIQHLPAEKLRNIRYPLPPLLEQNAIVAFVNQETDYIDSVCKEISASILLLKERRAALITAAVTGQIQMKEMTV